MSAFKTFFALVALAFYGEALAKGPTSHDSPKMENNVSIKVIGENITLSFPRSASILGMKRSMSFPVSDVLKVTVSKREPEVGGFRVFGIYIPFTMRVGSFYSPLTKDWEYWDVNYFRPGEYCELYLKNQEYTRVILKVRDLQQVRALENLESAKYWEFGRDQTRQIATAIQRPTHTFAARIVTPKERAPKVGLLMLPGSGPTDKDWNSPSLSGDNGSGKTIAEFLARDGFASIAFDKLKTPGNTYQGEVSWEKYLEDQKAALEALKKELPSIEKVYVLGHSEGSLHALRLCEEHPNEFSGLILLAPPGRTLKEIIISQITEQVGKIPIISDSKKQTALGSFSRGLNSIAQGRPLAAEALNLPFYLKKAYDIFSKKDTLAYSEGIFDYDPKQHLENIQAPVLLVAAGKDQQAIFEKDAQALLSHAQEHQKAQVTMKVMKDANHVFKYEPKPLDKLGIFDALAYNKPTKVVDPEVVTTISEWLKGQISE